MTRVRVVSLRSFDRLIADLSPKAYRAWSRSIEWSLVLGTDGFLAADDIKAIGPTPAAHKELLQRGVWKVDEDGRTFVAELREGPVAADVDGREVEHPSSNAARQKRYRERKRNAVTRVTPETVTGDITRDAQCNVTRDVSGVTGGPIGGSGSGLSGSSPDPESSSVLASDPKDLTGSARDSETRAKVEQVFAHWVAFTGKPKAVLDRKREQRIRARLREGFTPDQLCRAITNARHDRFLMGENKESRVYNGMQTLLRDAEQVERLLALVPNGNRASNELRPDRAEAVEKILASARRPVDA